MTRIIKLPESVVAVRSLQVWKHRVTLVVLPGHNEVVRADVHRFSVSVASVIIEFRSVLSIAVDS